MEKITFVPEDAENSVDFYVLEQTRINGMDYILVTESQEEEAEAFILKDISGPGDGEAVYEAVADDEELEAVADVFEELLEDVSFE